MYESNFNRIEQKYLLTKEQYQELFRCIDDFIEKDKFYSSKICNVYFDNVNEELTTHSIEKPLFKQKVRLRSYGVPSLDDDVFLEVKTKYKSVVTKRRIKIGLKEFYEYFKGDKKNLKKQIMSEIDYLFRYFDLKPFYFLAYDRKSYHGRDDNELRITIDENLRSRRNDLFLEKGDEGNYYFDNEIYIMEIKYLNALPLWLVQRLSDLRIYPTSFSKLGSVYKKNRRENLC